MVFPLAFVILFSIVYRKFSFFTTSRWKQLLFVLSKDKLWGFLNLMWRSIIRGHYSKWEAGPTKELTTHQPIHPPQQKRAVFSNHNAWLRTLYYKYNPWTVPGHYWKFTGAKVICCGGWWLSLLFTCSYLVAHKSCCRFHWTSLSARTVKQVAVWMCICSCSIKNNQITLLVSCKTK